VAIILVVHSHVHDMAPGGAILCTMPGCMLVCGGQNAAVLRPQPDRLDIANRNQFSYLTGDRAVGIKAYSRQV